VLARPKRRLSAVWVEWTPAKVTHAAAAALRTSHG
jgi:hypothetical protein